MGSAFKKSSQSGKEQKNEQKILLEICIRLPQGTDKGSTWVESVMAQVCAQLLFGVYIGTLPPHHHNSCQLAAVYFHSVPHFTKTVCQEPVNWVGVPFGTLIIFLKFYFTQVTMLGLSAACLLSNFRRTKRFMPRSPFIHFFVFLPKWMNPFCWLHESIGLMEQNSQSRNKPICIWTAHFCQRYKSLTNSAGIIRHPDAKLKIDLQLNVCKS